MRSLKEGDCGKEGSVEISRKDQDNGAVNSHPKLQVFTQHTKRFSQTLCVATKTSPGLAQARPKGQGRSSVLVISNV